MDQKTSTDYSVDQRYSGAKGATDDNAGKQFLKRYLGEEKHVGVSSAGTVQPRDLTAQRREDDRVVLGGMGGTVAVGNLGLGQQINSTNTAYSYKNPFGSMRGPSQKRTARALQ
jgi:hypothetical protein